MEIFIWLISLGALAFVFLYRHGFLKRKGLASAIPQLPYLDKVATLEFYEKVLDFKIMSDWDGYIITKKDAIEIHLWQSDNPEIPKNTGCYIRVNKNIDTLYAQYLPHNIMHEHGKLEVKPWNMKQFSLLDNSGNILHFGQDVTTIR